MRLKLLKKLTHSCNAYHNNPPAGGQFQDSPPEAILSIPWRHNSVLVEKLKKPEERMWYAQKTIEHGWSRSVLEIMIENSLHSRQGKAITNFEAVMPSPQSDLAQQAALLRHSFQGVLSYNLR